MQKKQFPNVLMVIPCKFRKYNKNAKRKEKKYCDLKKIINFVLKSIPVKASNIIYKHVNQIKPLIREILNLLIFGDSSINIIMN